MDENILKSVTPKDCAVLLGIPLTRMHFFEDVKLFKSPNIEDRRGEFAMNHCNGADDDDIEIGWDIYKQYVYEFAEAFRIIAQKSGALVFENATISSVGEAFSSGCSAVIIVAHWKDYHWKDYDLGSAAGPRLAKFLIEDLEPEAAHFLRFLTERNISLDYTTRLRVLAHELNEFMELPQTKTREDLRDYFDSGLRGVAVAGNSLELRDGYHSSGSVAELVPAEWSGVAELGVCQSLRLALKLKMGLQNRRILTNDNPKILSRTFSELAEQFLRLSEKAQPYIPLRRRIHKDFSNLFGKERR